MSDGTFRLVTAALPYCNAEPHLGNLIGSTLSADVFARFSKSIGIDTMYICGTDRYGTATEIKAMEEKTTPEELCRKYHAIHEEVYRFFQLQFDHFGSTDTPLHTKITHEIIDHLNENGCLLTKPTQTCFCTTCQRFLSDRFVTGNCPNCNASDTRGDQCDVCGQLTHSTTLLNPACHLCRKSTLEFRVSTHQFLKFDQTQHKVKQWMKPSITTSYAYATTMAKLNEPIPAKDITRDLSWGVRVPEKYNLANQVYYVWMEAPLGYMSITANATPRWRDIWTSPNTELYHFIGKDNILFHTIYFPSTLIGARQNWILPKHVSATHYLMFEGKKFSKSRNVGVFGMDAMKSNYESDVWRFALLRLRPESSDSDFTMKFLEESREWLRCNIANLSSRICKFIETKYGGVVPYGKFIEHELTTFMTWVDEYKVVMNQVRLRDGLELAMKLVHELNAYMNRSKFWALDDCRDVMYTAINLFAWVSVVWSPITPTLAYQIHQQLGASYLLNHQNSYELVCGGQHLPSTKHLIKMNKYL
jgi:methionyl-tRNA synthetase